MGFSLVQHDVALPLIYKLVKEHGGQAPEKEMKSSKTSKRSAPQKVQEKKAGHKAAKPKQDKQEDAAPEEPPKLEIEKPVAQNIDIDPEDEDIEELLDASHELDPDELDLIPQDEIHESIAEELPKPPETTHTGFSTTTFAQKLEESLSACRFNFDPLSMCLSSLGETIEKQESVLQNVIERQDDAKLQMNSLQQETTSLHENLMQQNGALFPEQMKEINNRLEMEVEYSRQKESEYVGMFKAMASQIEKLEQLAQTQSQQIQNLLANRSSTPVLNNFQVEEVAGSSEIDDSMVEHIVDDCTMEICFEVAQEAHEEAQTPRTAPASPKVESPMEEAIAEAKVPEAEEVAYAAKEYVEEIDERLKWLTDELNILRYELQQGTEERKVATPKTSKWDSARAFTRAQRFGTALKKALDDFKQAEDDGDLSGETAYQKIDFLANRVLIHEDNLNDVFNSIEEIQQKLRTMGPGNMKETDMETLFDSENKDNTRNTSVAELRPLAEKSQVSSPSVKQFEDYQQKIAKEVNAIKKKASANELIAEENKLSLENLSSQTKDLSFQLKNLIENQELLKELTGSYNDGGGGQQTMDLSAVFSKLTELRHAHDVNADNLRRAIDDVYDHVKLSDLQIKELKAKFGDSARETINNADKAIATQRKKIEKLLYTQEHMKINIQDWKTQVDGFCRQASSTLTPALRNAIIQGLHANSRRYFKSLPVLSQAIAAPVQIRNELENISYVVHNCRQFIAEDDIQLNQSISHTLESVKTTNDLIAPVDKKNDTLCEDFDYVRSQMDKLQTLIQPLPEKQDQAPGDKQDEKAVVQAPVSPVLPPVEPKPVVKDTETQTREVFQPSEAPHPEEYAKAFDEIHHRVDTVEDEIDNVTSGVKTCKERLEEKTDKDYIAKLKRKIYTEFAKLHTAMSMLQRSNKSSISQRPISIPAPYDDSSIQNSLDEHATMLAQLWSKLPTSASTNQSIVELSENPTTTEPNPSENENALRMVNKIAVENEGFQFQLEGITSRVAEMFVTLEASRKSEGPRNVVPTLNNAQLLDEFMSDVEARMTSMSEMNTEDFKRIRSELNQHVRKKIKKAVKVIKGTAPDHSEGTALGRSTVVCIACNRPAPRYIPPVDQAPADLQSESMEPASTMALTFDGSDRSAVQSEIQREEPEYIYRAGFKMPVHSDKKSQPSSTLPQIANRNAKLRKRMKKSDAENLGDIIREVDSINATSTDTSTKVGEERRPVPPPKRA